MRSEHDQSIKNVLKRTE